MSEPRCIPADHFDQIGQLVGDAPGDGDFWSHTEFWVELVDELRARGY